MKMNDIKTYACYNTDESIRLNSSSGAVFSLLADYVLEKHGIVYGVAMSEDCYSAEYLGITRKEDLHKLRGSKYLQAKVGNAFREIKQNLTDGKVVLFSGTGCQVNGLKKYLGKEYDNLLCVDVICHGTPSPELWKKYVLYQENKHNGKLRHINFRCKNDGWQDFGMHEVMNDIPKCQLKKVYISKDVDSYMQMFLKDYCLRPSCYNCMVKKVKMSDLTIADFWGIDSVAPEMNDGKGTSLVLIRSEVGRRVFDIISNKIKFKEVTYEEGVCQNPSEYSSVKRPEERNAFFENMNKLSFEQLEKVYDLPKKLSIKNKVKKRMKHFLKTYVLNREGQSNADYGLLFMFEDERNS